jgi:hypothetical protein
MIRLAKLRFSFLGAVAVLKMPEIAYKIKEAEILLTRVQG